MLILTDTILGLLEFLFLISVGRDVYWSRTEKPIDVKRLGVMFAYIVILLAFNVLIIKFL